MERKWLTSVLVAVVLCALVGATGCWNPFNPEEDEGDDPTPPVTYDRSSRMNLIKFFAKAHEDRDIEDYEICLHADYQFWFSEDDRTDPNWDWRDWIGKSDDVEVTTNMFGAEDVTEIRMEFFNETIVPGAQDDEDRFIVETTIVGEDTLNVYRGNFRLTMHVLQETSEEPVDHFVDGRAHLYLLPDPIYEGLWTVWMIEDKGNEH